MAMMLQYLSGKLGIATGKDLAELVRSSLKSWKLIVPYWLAAEAAAAATDLAEYLGTVIALNLLFHIRARARTGDLSQSTLLLRPSGQLTQLSNSRKSLECLPRRGTASPPRPC
jgi:hypothetical protein